MDGLDVPHGNEQGMVMGVEQVDVSSGQKRPATSNDNTPRKKSKTDQGDEEEIQVTQAATAYPSFSEGGLMQNPGRDMGNPLQSPFGLRRQDAGDQSFEGGYDVSGQGRKTGRMTGAKGYSLQEIQTLFSLIRQKPPVDNSDWVSLAMKYNQWAKENKKSPRTGRGLKDKLRKVALVSKDDKLKPMATITPLQQEARDCLKFITMATTVPLDDKDEEKLDLNYVGGGVDQRDRPVDPSYSLQQLNEVAMLLRTILGETRSTSQRLSAIEQMLENIKGTGECGLDDLHGVDGVGVGVVGGVGVGLGVGVGVGGVGGVVGGVGVGGVGVGGVGVVGVGNHPDNKDVCE